MPSPAELKTVGDDSCSTLEEEEEEHFHLILTGAVAVFITISIRDQLYYSMSHPYTVVKIKTKAFNFYSLFAESLHNLLRTLSLNWCDMRLRSKRQIG